MSADRSDGTTKSNAVNTETEATQRTKNDRGRSGQATPVDRRVSNDTFTSQRHKFTEREHRTGLRRIDDHASWRAVYRACHIGVGIDD